MAVLPDVQLYHLVVVTLVVRKPSRSFRLGGRWPGREPAGGAPVARHDRGAEAEERGEIVGGGGGRHRVGCVRHAADAAEHQRHRHAAPAADQGQPTAAVHRLRPAVRQVRAAEDAVRAVRRGGLREGVRRLQPFDRRQNDAQLRVPVLQRRRVRRPGRRRVAHPAGRPLEAERVPAASARH